MPKSLERFASFRFSVIVLLSAFIFLACNRNIPEKAISSADLPFATTTYIDISLLQAHINQSVLIKANVIPIKEVPSVRPHGTVSFFYQDRPLCLNVPVNLEFEASCETHFSKEGEYLIYAIYNGGTEYYKTSRSIDFTLRVDPPYPITIKLFSIPGSARVNSAVTFHAQLIPTKIISGILPSGTLSFYEDEKLLCENVPLDSTSLSADCTTSFLQEGEHFITVVYSGMYPFYASGKSETFTQKVGQESIHIELKSSQSGPISPDTQISVYAELHGLVSTIPSSGTYTFQLDKENIKSCTNQEQSFCTLQISRSGAHQISVLYQNDKNYTDAYDYLNINVLKRTQIQLKSDPFFTENHKTVLDIAVQCADNCPIGGINKGEVTVFEVNSENSTLIPLSSCSNIPVNQGHAQCLIKSSLHNESAGLVLQANYTDNSVDPIYSDSSSKTHRISADPIRPVNSIYIITGSGELAYSTNNGKFWIYPENQPVNSNIDKLSSLFITPSGNIYVGSESGNIFVSYNKGSTWNNITPKLNESSSVKSLHVSPDYKLLALFQNGKYYFRNLSDFENSQWEIEKNYSESIPKIADKTPIVSVEPFLSDMEGEARLAVYENGGLSCSVADNTNLLTSYNHTKSDVVTSFLGYYANSRAIFSIDSNSDLYVTMFSILRSNVGVQECFAEFQSEKIGSIPTKGVKVNKLFVAGKSIYTLFNNRIGFLEDLKNAATWNVVKAPDGQNPRDIFVLPILYAVSSNSLSSEREIKFSNDNAHSWRSIKNGFFDAKTMSLNTFFVTPGNGYFYTVLENSEGEKLAISKDSGFSWNPLERNFSQHADATALWIHTDVSEEVQDLNFVVGHQNGLLSFSNSKGITEHRACVDRTIENSTCIVTSILPHMDLENWYISLYANTDYISPEEGNSRFYGFAGAPSLATTNTARMTMQPWRSIETDNWDETHLVFAPRHSITTQPDTGILYESINLRQNQFNSNSENIIRKRFYLNHESGETIKELLRYPEKYMNAPFIPINLYAAENNALYVSFINKKESDAERNAEIYLTTDDGKTWDPLKTQPYSGNQATSHIFVQYQNITR